MSQKMELRTGKYLISSGKALAGELKIDGPKSYLILRDDEVFAVGGEAGFCIPGNLYDQTKVTLIDCMRVGAETHTIGEQGVKSHSETIFPNFVAEGRVHLVPNKPTIAEIAFTFEDVTSLFYDFDAFGASMDPTEFIEPIVAAHAKRFHRKISTGPDPEIAYFTGQRLIAQTDTAIGSIRVEHCPSLPIGGPRGVQIANEIWITITPEGLVTFEDAVERLLTALRFVALAVGRAQNLPRFVLKTNSGGALQALTIHWSHHPRRTGDLTGKWDTPQPADLPLQPIQHPQEFVAVLKAWLAVDNERRVARVRIHQALAHQDRYTVDRLVGAANAFDLLPESAVPKRVPLSSQVSDLIDHCKPLFRKLPKSDERESLLRALGRLGKASLKQKVRFRANLITAAAPDRFPLLELVCDQAVECRNHFVHGSSAALEPESLATHQSFLTDSLEFVFAASELVEAGWDIKRFLATPTSETHLFGVYRVSYAERLTMLRADLKEAEDSDEL